MLWGELFTSLVANTYGLVSRFRLEESRSYLWKLALVLILAALVSRFGFARLLQKVYPLYGCFAWTVLVPLALRPLPPPKEEADKARKRRFFDQGEVDIRKMGNTVIIRRLINQQTYGTGVVVDGKDKSKPKNERR